MRKHRDIQKMYEDGMIERSNKLTTHIVPHLD